MGLEMLTSPHGALLSAPPLDIHLITSGTYGTCSMPSYQQANRRPTQLAVVASIFAKSFISVILGLGRLHLYGVELPIRRSVGAEELGCIAYRPVTPLFLFESRL